MPTTRQGCSEPIYPSTFPEHPCAKPVVGTEDGKPWCKIHLPSNIAAKWAARSAKREYESKAIQARDRLGYAGPALLKAAKAVIAAADVNMQGYRLSTPIGIPLLEQLRAAITDAEK